MKMRYFFSTLLFILWSGQMSAQPPTGHAEVWHNVMSYWELWAQRDLDGYLDYFHPGYSGWNYSDPMHKNKRSSAEWLNHDFATNQVITYDVNAIDIKIHDNVAVVHYYYSILDRNSQDMERRTNGRKTDVLTKQGDKWLIIADHGGDVDRE